MQRRDDAALNVVVVDYQRCAFAPENRTDKHFLSPKLISFLTSGLYNHFVGHTFRCIINIDEFREKLLEDVPVSEHKKFKENFPTAKITEHLAARTQVPCLAVATLDDLVTKQIGQGYEDLVNYESSGVISQNKHVQSDQQFDLMKQNNTLLLLIAQNIAAKHPDRPVILDIIDDDLSHCKQASTLDQQADWPATVKLNHIYRFDTKILNDEVTLISSPDNRAIAATAVAPHKQQKPYHSQHAALSYRPLDTVQADTAYAASVLVAGTYGTFSRPIANSATAAAAANPDKPRRSARLAEKCASTTRTHSP